MIQRSDLIVPVTVQPRAATLFERAVAVANIPTLLMVLVQLTGDLGWLDERYRPKRERGMGDNDTGGLREDVQDEIRAGALDAILAWRSGQPVGLLSPSEDLLVEMLAVAMGEPVPSEFGPMMAAELAAAQNPSGSISAHPPTAEVDVPPDFGVLVIGAGVSGLCAAVNLQAAGIPYTIVEKNETLGGVWVDNRYPGAGVDTPNHLYSFSFAEYDWSHYFVLREELHSYLEDVADRFDVRRKVTFGTEALAARYDETSRTWRVDVRHRDGAEETLEANVILSAVGIFNPPKVPAITGLDAFEGDCVHTGRWPTGMDVTGKRVAVIGNGASAMQVVPAIAERVASLTIFQRSTHWAAPFENFQRPVPEEIRFLLAEVPLYRLWYRLRLGWVFNDRTYASLQKDPEWPHPERSLNAINDAHRAYFTDYVKAELGDRQDLLELVVPTYPPFGKRMLMDNGWYRTLTRDNVELIVDPIDVIGRDRIVTQSRTEHEVDTIILATGFDVARFVSTVDIRGRSGKSLREVWDDDDARAYLGTAVPGFPNFFMLYGPNTQPGHGGSLTFIVEAQMHYVRSVLTQMLASGAASVEVRQDVHDDYCETNDRLHENMVWTHPGMQTYYRNSRGRVIVNTPYRNVDVWHMTRSANLDDYIVEVGVGGPVANGASG